MLDSTGLAKVCRPLRPEVLDVVLEETVHRMPHAQPAVSKGITDRNMSP